MKILKNCCLASLIVLVVFIFGFFFFIKMLFSASPGERQYGSEELMTLLTQVDLPPERVTTDGSYAYEGGGLTFEAHYTKEMMEAHPVLKTSPSRVNDHLEVYVLTSDDMNYFALQENLFNPALIYFLEEKSRVYLESMGKTVDIRHVILAWNDKEKFKKGIKAYERALDLVDITDNSKENRIDTITLKSGKEANLDQLMDDMYTQGLMDETSNE
ncbi:hypothetical protein ACVR05_09940 [Streptococcus caprae]|uniref:DUF4825 domain-containing protein n=1 Tax=Streptococcus caprae TaxID=1640501 RepID=A0ABV8CVN1_9STRE